MKLLRFILALITMCLCSWEGWGQTSYTVAGSGQCVSASTITVGGTTLYRGAIKLSATMSGSTVNFTVEGCLSGSSFSAGTTFHLKEATSSSITTVAGQSTDAKTVTSGSATSAYSFTYSLPFTSGTRYYVVVYTNGSLFACTEVVSITASTTSQPPSTPSSPNPGNGATGISTSPTLSWSSSIAGGGSVGYDLYYGTSSSNMTSYVSGTGTSRTLSGLQAGTTYYWKVISYNSQNVSAQGPVWSFTTINNNQAPSQPSNPSPANNATGIGLNPTFSWNSVDPDGDQVYYKLMLSTIENSLPVEKQGTGTSTTSPYTLQAGVTYYWKIESYDSQGKTSIGPTWRFTTAGPTINPVLSLSTTSVVLGNSLTVSGSSFSANNQVQLIFSRANGTQFLSTYVGTSSSGSFTYNYATTEVGTITVTATDAASGQQRSTSFSVTNPPAILSVSRNAVNFPAVGGMDTIQILSSNVNWSVNKSDSWITIDKTSGSGNGIINIAVPQNTSTNQLSGTITVSGSGVASQIVNITQLGAAAPPPYLNVSPSGDPQNPVPLAGDNGASITFTVSSNIDWTATITNSATSWLSITKNSSTSFTVKSLNGNDTGWPRGAVVTVSGAGVTSQTINIRQEALPVTPVYYTVTFNSDGGSAVSSKQVVAGNAVDRPSPDPTKSGYTFDGWYNGSAVWNFSNPVNENMTLTAKWTVNTPTPFLTVSPSGTAANPVPLAGDNGASITFTVSSNIDWTATITNSATSWLSITKNSSTSFTVKSLNGNDTGWPRGAVVTVSGAGVTSQTINIRQEALPVTPVYYTVTFNSDGGSAVSSKQVVAGNAVDRPSPDPTKSGYTFDGWYNGSAVWNFSNPVNANMTLTAKWTENTPTPYLTVSPSGTAANPVQLAGNKDATIVFSVSSNIDWTVAITNSATSWLSITKNSNTSFTVKSLNGNDTGGPRGAVLSVSGVGVTSQQINIRQEALPVTPVYYTVTFNSDGGSAVSTKQVVAGNTVDRPSPDPTKSGYSFDGWYNGSTLWNFNNPVNANMTLTARWTVNTPTPYLTVSPSGTAANPVQLAGEKDATIVFSVSSNVDWTVAITNSATSWLSVTKNSNTSFTARSLNGNDNGGPRGAVLSVSGVGVTSQQINIRQDALAATTNVVFDSDFSFGTTNLTVGQPYTLSGYVKNTGTSNYAGYLILRELNGTGVYQSNPVSIAPNPTSRTLVQFTVKPSQSKNSVQYYMTANNVNVTTGAYRTPTVNYVTPVVETKKGIITVNITNSSQVEGAKWSCDGGVTWLFPGSKELIAGSYTIKFNAVQGWNTPKDIVNINVPANSAVSVTGTYTPVNLVSSSCGANDIRLITPLNGANGVPTMPTFEWYSVPTAYNYEVSVSGGANGSITVGDNRKDTQSASITGMTLEKNKSYSAEIKAFNSSRVQIACVSFTFTTRGDEETKPYESVYDDGNVKVMKNFGEALGHFNNVIAYFNGSHNWQQTTAKDNKLCNSAKGGAGTWLCQEYQCTKYGERFFDQYHHLYLELKTAKDYIYYNMGEHGINYVPYRTGLIPPVGALLVYSISHVSIVTAADNNKVSIIQQNGYPFQQDITYSKFASNGIVGWQTPAVVSLNYTEGIFTIKSDFQGVIKDYKLFIKKLEGNVYKDILNSPFDINKISQIPLEKGKYVARVQLIFSSKQSDRVIQSRLLEDIDITVNTNVRVLKGAISAVTAAENGYGLRAGSVDGNHVTNAKIYQRDGDNLILKGSTDEEGKLFVEFIPALKEGDMIVVEAEGYETSNIKVTKQMVDNKTFNLLLNKTSSARIVNPKVFIENYSPVFVSDVVAFNVQAQNMTGYQITLMPDCECIPELTQKYTSDSEMATINGLQEGNNTFKIDLYNDIDTVSLYKTVFYNPDAQNSMDDNLIVVNSSSESFGAAMFVDGNFIKNIEHTTESILLPKGYHQLSFTKDGYQPYFENVDIATVIILDLNKFEENATDIPAIPANNNQTVNVYPNPTTGIIKIGCDDVVEAIELFDLTGKVVLKIQFNQLNPEFSIDNFPNGYYLLRVITNDRTEVKKIIKI